MNARAGLLALLLLCACQREQWELPAALGTPQRSSNYSAAAELPPSIPLLLPLDAADTSGCVVPPLVLSSRRWIMATSGGSLLSVSATRVDWLFRLPGGAIATSLAADSSRVYALATDGMLYALSYEGKLLWSTAAFAPLDSGAAYAHLLPFSDGVLAASLAGELLCFSGDGQLRWHSNRAAPIGRLPAAFADAVTLSSGPGVPGETDTMVLLDASTGQQRWARALPLTAISSGPVVGDRFLAVAGIRYNPESSPAAVLHAFSPTGSCCGPSFYRHRRASSPLQTPRSTSASAARGWAIPSPAFCAFRAKGSYSGSCTCKRSLQRHQSSFARRCCALPARVERSEHTCSPARMAAFGRSFRSRRHHRWCSCLQ
jgi:hypothetical protein